MTRRKTLIAAGAAVIASKAVAQTPKRAHFAAEDDIYLLKSPDLKNGQGKPGDFDFLTGEWRIKWTMRDTKSPEGVVVYDSEATVIPRLKGVGSLEELRTPSRNYMGMGLRFLDLETKIWNDIFVNAKSALIVTPGQAGYFIDGVGIFELYETIDGKQTVTRGVWDKITKNSCRWYQGFSEDNGKTWAVDGYMHWTRVS